MYTLPLTPTEIAAWLRLTETRGIGPTIARKLLAEFGLPEEIFKQSHSALTRITGAALANVIKRPLTDDFDQRVACVVEWAAMRGNHFVTLSDTAYPSALFHLTNPPLLLYVKGQLTLLHRPSIGIVGSRNATPQGLANAEQFSHALAKQGFTIVSGLALGIDGAAHRGALKGCGSTIAVMGTGIDLIYPTQHQQLAQQISQQGALISEWPLGTPARAQHFPQRNRLIAALSQTILVIEAAAQSGSLITAHLATEMGRDVGALPGSVHSPLAKGCHQLIKEGAKLIESVQDVVDEIRPMQTQLTNTSPSKDKARERRPLGSPREARNPHASQQNKNFCRSATIEALQKGESQIQAAAPISINTDAQPFSTRNKNVDEAQLASSDIDFKQNKSQSNRSQEALQSSNTLDENSRRVLEALGYDSTALELLVARTGLTSAVLQATLLKLELEGWIATLPGGRIARQQKSDLD